MRRDAEETGGSNISEYVHSPHIQTGFQTPLTPTHFNEITEVENLPALNLTEN